MRLGIVGHGVVGKATAYAFREHEVRTYDVDPTRSDTSLDDTLACDLVFVCLPTPQKKSSLECDTSILDEFFRACVVLHGSDARFVLRSTVPIGYTRRTAERFGFPVLVHSPEFLTARTAVEDACNPTRMLIGETTSPVPAKWCPPCLPRPSSYCGRMLYKLYCETWPQIKPHIMSSDESEAVKLFQNGFSAVKIAFFNEVRSLCDKLGMDWDRVLQALLAGGWINPMHTQVPGPDGKRGFGGACLPKDLANLITCLLKHNVEPWVTNAALTCNEQEDRQ